MNDELPGDIPPSEKTATRTRAGARRGSRLRRAGGRRPLRRSLRRPPARRPSRPRSGKKNLRRKAKAVEEQIGHVFADSALLTTALTHVSALKNPADRWGSYQRLEFLGDHVLGLVVSDMLFRAYPNADEGELSKRLADLVRRETCAEVAKAHGAARGDQARRGRRRRRQRAAAQVACWATSARR